jgi:hypothetical protein
MFVRLIFAAALAALASAYTEVVLVLARSAAALVLLCHKGFESHVAPVVMVWVSQLAGQVWWALSKWPAILPMGVRSTWRRQTGQRRRMGFMRDRPCANRIQ